MKITLLHYHLKTGGVTTVVRQQVAAIQGTCQVCVLAGETGGTAPPVNTRILPELAYSQTAGTPEAVAEKILVAMESVFGGPCDVLHVHNPTLAKNVNLLKILKVLQDRGVKMLLQIHDFAEDGRPQNFSHEKYPANCHYAVINSRDYKILQNAGLKATGLHLLPNMIDVPPIDPAGSAVRPWILYPIRSLRRKNLGEAVLLSLYLAPGDSIGITQAPNSLSDWKSYRNWQKFVDSHQLRVKFELGDRQGFSELMQSAKYVITTSMAEGFGFSFLEPWIYGKALLGRKLPAICRDFENKGISLQHLYSRLRIPTGWFDHRRFYRKWSGHLRQVARQFGTVIPDGYLRTAFTTMTASGDLDFGLMDEATQQLVIERLTKHSVLRERLRAYNPFLTDFLAVRLPQQKIAANRKAVLSEFSSDAYRQQLLTAYAAVLHPVIHRIRKKRLISAFFHPPSCSLLRWELPSG